MLDDVSDPGISAFEEEREKKTWLVWAALLCIELTGLSLN
jgi:hypothetical protein